MVSRKRSVAIAAGLTTAALVVCAPVAHAILGTSADSTCSATARTEQVTSRLSDELESDYSHDQSFGGVWHGCAAIHVRTVGSPSERLAHRLAADRRLVPVDRVRSANSLPELLSVTRQISRDSTVLASRGIVVAAVGPDEVNGKVKISLQHYSVRSADYLVREYGETRVYVGKESLEPLAAG